MTKCNLFLIVCRSWNHNIDAGLCITKVLTLTGLERNICPSLVKDWKDTYVPLLSRHGDVIMLAFRASCIWWCNKNYYIVISG